jgi:hypothetical protein
MRSDTAPDPTGTDDLQLVVRQLSRCADGVVSLVLADPSGRDLPAWEPGAHVDVCMPGVTRQYSLCGDPAERGSYRLGVLLEPKSRAPEPAVAAGLRRAPALLDGLRRRAGRLRGPGRHPPAG